MSHIRTSTAILAALCSLALAGCGDQPPSPPDTRPRAEVAGPIAMPDGWDAKVVVLPTGERVLMASRSWQGKGGREYSIAAVLLPPVAAEGGKGVGP